MTGHEGAKRPSEKTWNLWRKPLLKPQTLRKNGKPRIRRRFKVLIGVLIAVPSVFITGLSAQYWAEVSTVDQVIRSAATLDAKAKTENAPKLAQLATPEAKKLLNAPIFHSTKWNEYASAVTTADATEIATLKRQMLNAAYSSITYPNVRARYLTYINSYTPSLLSDQKVQIYALGVIGGTCSDIAAGVTAAESVKRFAPVFTTDASGTVLPALVAYAGAICPSR